MRFCRCLAEREQRAGQAAEEVGFRPCRRFIGQTFADRSVVPEKPTRYPYRNVTFDKSRKKGF